MLVTGARRWTMCSSLLYMAIFLCSLIGTSEVISSDVAETTGAKLKIEGGWSEVKEGWPMDAEDYFLATEKGHHFVESQDLPANSKYDLQVTFEYYYSYSRTKPVLQMTPCTENVFLIENESSLDRSNKWLTHKYQVDRKKCIKRNQIAYNILLHDPGDVFAWKVLKIESIIPPVQTTEESTYVITEGTSAKPVETTTPKPIVRTTEKPVESTKRPISRTTPTSELSTKDEIVDLIDGERNPTPESQGTEGQKIIQDIMTDAQKRKAELLSKQSTQKPTTVDPTTPRPKQTIEGQLGGTTKGPTSATTSTFLDLSRTSQASIAASSTPPGVTEEPASTLPTTPAITDKPTSPKSTTSHFIEDTSNTLKMGTNDELPKSTESSSPFLETKGALPTSSTAPEDHKTRREEPVAAIPPLNGPRETVSPADEEKASEDKRLIRFDDQIYASLNQRRRRKRAALGELDGDQEAELVNAICAPSSCNKHQFKMAHFSALIKGLPKRVRKGQTSKYLINLKNKPLTMTVESHEESLAEVDTCVSFLLYMEAGTELELLLADASSPGADDQRDQLLELIKRKAGDSTAGRWEKFARCISDYMPEYKPKRSLINGRVDEDNSLRLILRPKGAQQPGEVAVLIPEQYGSHLTPLYRKQSFLPDINRMGDTEDFKRYWIVDRDGLAKPQLSQTTALPVARPKSNSTTDGNGAKVLRIENIDSTQESFDLTSRWLQIKDAETLELPIQFVYKAEQAEWIERVDFQFQRSSAAADDWISQVAYRAPRTQLADPTEPPTKVEGDQQPTAGLSEKTPSNSDASKSGPKTIELPIELKGLDSNEFRLRVRHYLKRASTYKQRKDISNSHELNIKSLAFADACSYGRHFCRNNGECKPTGPSRAECICPQGYTGRFCEHVRPCEVLYTAGDGKQLTGDELCRSVGARCVNQLPVMRCEWPNDKYYQCKKLFRLNASGQGYTPIQQTPPSGTRPILPNSDGGSLSSDDGQMGGEEPFELDDETQLREKLDKSQGVVNQQAKLIIILAVFIVAILIFAIVLVGSMVGRLRKSSRRLKKSQGELHELSRRTIHPGGFGSSLARPVASTSKSGPPRPGNKNSGSPASVVGYNNSAFDVES